MPERRHRNQRQWVWLSTAALLLYSLLSLHSHHGEGDPWGDPWSESRPHACVLCLSQSLTSDAADIPRSLPIILASFAVVAHLAMPGLSRDPAPSYTSPQQPRAPPNRQAAR